MPGFLKSATALIDDLTLVTADGDLPKLQGLATASGPVTVAPLSISVLVVNANNATCKE